MQFAFLMMLPSVLLSGFVFPRNEMPSPIYLLSFAIPATYFIEILRGIVLRGGPCRGRAGIDPRAKLAPRPRHISWLATTLPSRAFGTIALTKSGLEKRHI